MKRLVLCAAFVVAGALASTAGAVDATGVKITPTGDDQFPNKTYILALPQQRSLTTADVQVFENGEPVDSLSVTTPGAGGAGSATVLLVDASLTMRGKPIADALDAGRAFASRRTADQQLAVVTFNRETSLLLPFTADTRRIEDALATTPETRYGTVIYDAVAYAVDLIKQANVRVGTVVLLSDGQNVGSTVTLQAALDRLKEESVRLFSVGLRSPAYYGPPLRRLAEESGGTYSEVSDSGSLARIYDALGFKLANEYLIVYRSLAPLDRPVDVAVRVSGFDGFVTDRYVSPKLGTSAVIVEEAFADKAIKSPLSMFILIIVMLGIVGLAVGNYLRLRGRGRFRRRLGEYVTLPVEEQAAERRAEIAAVVSDRAKRPFRGAGWLRGFANDCEIAEVRWSPATLVFVGLSGAVIGGIVFMLIFGSVLALFLGVLAPIGVRAYVNFKLARKRRAFSEQLPDNLDVLASALRAGYSLVGALSVVADDAPEPSRSELRRVIADEQLGAKLEDAFEVCVQRMANRDLEQVALVALLQREAGGNAAEVIDQVADNIRGRMDLRRLVRTLTAQGRLARWIVSLLPVALFFVILLINRDYLRPLWTTGFGIAAMIVAGLMIISGSLVIKKIVNIKV